MKTPVVDKVFKLKMTPEVAAYTKGKHVVGLVIPLVFASGARIWMVEFNGGPTGRADLCTVIGTDRNLLILDRRVCWWQGKFDDNLDEFSLTVLPDAFTIIDGSAIPLKEEKK